MAQSRSEENTINHIVTIINPAPAPAAGEALPVAPIIPEAAQHPAQEEKGCHARQYLRHAVYVIPLINAVSDASQTSLGLAHKPHYISYPCTGLNLLTSFVMNSRFTIKGIHSSAEIIQNRKLPDDWMKIRSRRREKVALVTATAIGLYVTFTDAIQAYSMTSQLPADYDFQNSVSPHIWAIPCVVTAASVGVSVILTEGFETYEGIREFISENKVTYHNRLSGILSPTLSATFGSVGALNDSLNTFIAITSVFNVTSVTGRALLGAASILNGTSDFSMNGRFIRDTTNDVIAHLDRHRRIHAKETLSAILSTATAGFLAYSVQSLSQTYLEEAAQNFGVHTEGGIVDQAIEVFSWSAAANSTLINSASLYPLIYLVVDKLSQKLNAAYHYVFQQAPAHIPDIEAGQGRNVMDSDDEHAPLLADRLADPLNDEEQAPLPIASEAENAHSAPAHHTTPAERFHDTPYHEDEIEPLLAAEDRINPAILADSDSNDEHPSVSSHHATFFSTSSSSSSSAPRAPEAAIAPQSIREMEENNPPRQIKRTRNCTIL